MQQTVILKPDSLRDQAFQILKTRVIVGDFKPGEIYSAATIAQELGVSNSPVREALLSLVDMGLMEPVRNRGFRVVEVSEVARNQIIDIRIMLEVPAMVRLLDHPEALAALQDQVTPLLDEIEACAARRDFVRYLAADRELHLLWLGILDNARLSALINMLRDQTMLVGLSKLYADSELIDEARSHRALWAAMLAGQRGQVAKLMVDHMCANAGPNYRPVTLDLATGPS